MSEFLTVKEAAALLRMDRTTLIRSIRRGVVPAIRIPGTRKWLIDQKILDSVMHYNTSPQKKKT